LIKKNPQGLLLSVPDASQMREGSCQIAHHAVEMATESDYTQHMVQRQTSANKDQGSCGRLSLVLMSQIILNRSPLGQMRVAINGFCIRLASSCLSPYNPMLCQLGCAAVPWETWVYLPEVFHKTILISRKVVRIALQ